MQALLLGLVQGISEFLPISSTAHMLIVLKVTTGAISSLPPSIIPAMLNIIQLGSVLALLYYFRKSILNFIKDFLLLSMRKEMKDRANFGWWIKVAISTLPLVLVSLFGRDYLSFSFSDRVRWIVIVSMLVLFALLLYGADLYSERKFTKREGEVTTSRNITFISALLIGLAQTLAIIPGVSRLAITIIAALFLGLNRVDSAKYSFSLAIPALLGGALFDLCKISRGDLSLVPTQELLLAILWAAGVGVVTIKQLIGYLEKGSWRIFVIYRMILALIIYLCFI